MAVVVFGSKGLEMTMHQKFFKKGDMRSERSLIPFSLSLLWAAICNIKYALSLIHK
jgi:hypothetical protein